MLKHWYTENSLVKLKRHFAHYWFFFNTWFWLDFFNMTSGGSNTTAQQWNTAKLLLNGQRAWITSILLKAPNQRAMSRCSIRQQHHRSPHKMWVTFPNIRYFFFFSFPSKNFKATIHSKDWASELLSSIQRVWLIRWWNVTRPLIASFFFFLPKIRKVRKVVGTTGNCRDVTTAWVTPSLMPGVGFITWIHHRVS